MRFATFSALLLVLAYSGPGTSAVSWRQDSYNPNPASDDLILPMPCSGAMAFRRVTVPSAGPLDDHKITLGSTEVERGYAEFKRDTWLAGGFSSGHATGERHYFIGKYEVTQTQFEVFEEQCPDVDDQEGELPVTRITWGEAVLFAERYSEWLVANALDAIPTREGAVGFLRLPTETEWEFAARGGIAVSPGEFAAKTFVRAGEDLDAYVIHDGNSYRELNLIGTLKSNPLGIHDILGNAAELVLGSFRLTVVSHLHGQTGGFIRRGGSFRTRRQEIRTSHREEYPPVDRRGVRREKTTGFRLVLVAPVLPTRESVEATREAWRALQREPQAPAAPVQPATGKEDAVEEARRLAAAASNQQMRRRLEELAFIVAKSVQSRNQERQRAAREAMSAAVFAARWVMTDRKALRRWASLRDRGTNARQRERFRRNYANARRNATINLDHYIDLLTTMAQDYDDWEIEHQQPVLEAVYRAQGQETARGLVEVVRRHVGAVRDLGPEEARERIVESLERRL